jgi:two-component system, LuxR family, response regulator FixJ
MVEDQTLEATVFIVDDDPHICDLLQKLLESAHLRAKYFVSSMEFLDFIRPDISGCLILDVCMPGIGGLELQNELMARKIGLPIIFISGFGDIPLAVGAVKNGAFDFIEKPIRASMLIDTVQNALTRDRKIRSERSNREVLKTSLARLTDRERDVLSMIMEGVPNKAIAGRMGLSHKTVESHRSRLMTKLGVDSLAKLIQIVISAGDDK